jgi:hypothetical protein
VSRGFDHPSLSPDILDKLNKCFPFILSNWARQQTVHARVHAEIRIILQLSPGDHSFHPIGVGKRSFFCCALWIGSHNHISEANGRSSIDKGVLEIVGMRLVDTLEWLFPGQRRISDEGGDEDDEQEMPEWRLKVSAVFAGLQYSWPPSPNGEGY